MGEEITTDPLRSQDIMSGYYEEFFIVKNLENLEEMDRFL